MTSTSRTFRLHPGETDDLAIGFGRILKPGETLSGSAVVTVHHRTSPYGEYADATISQVNRNTEAKTDEDGFVHEIDEAVEFRIALADGAELGEFDIRAESPTTNGRNPVEDVKLYVEGPPKP